MPIYSFECEEHGEFDELRRMDCSGEDAYCPVCGEKSSRVLEVPFIHVSGGTRNYTYGRDFNTGKKIRYDSKSLGGRRDPNTGFDYNLGFVGREFKTLEDRNAYMKKHGLVEGVVEPKSKSEIQADANKRWDAAKEKSRALIERGLSNERLVGKRK